MSLALLRKFSLRPSSVWASSSKCNGSRQVLSLITPVAVTGLNGEEDRLYSTMTEGNPIQVVSLWKKSNQSSITQKTGAMMRWYHATSCTCFAKKGGDDKDDDADGEFLDSYKEQLVDILDRELSEEKLNKDQNEMPEELVELKKTLTTEGWKIVEDDQSAIVRLVRNERISNLKVQVSFHCQDLVENEMDREEEEEEEEDEEEPSNPVRFTVVASNAGQSFVFGCLSSQGMTQIQSLAVTSSTDETSLLEKGSVPAPEYQGPEFFELADDLQQSFQDFVEVDLGIDEDVAAFIAMYADYKEQASYVNFLAASKKILS